jgi:hypothetical protein
VFHSIIGIRPKMSDPLDAYGPSEPIVGVKCSSAASASQEYEVLSRRTGGLRFPVCQTASYDAVFQQVAADVVDRVVVQCDFDPPSVPAGRRLDFDRVVVLHRPSDGSTPETLDRAASASACADGAFYVDGDRVTLCPETCDRVQDDPDSTVEVNVACRFIVD